jgi:hypothetical protein
MKTIIILAFLLLTFSAISQEKDNQQINYLDLQIEKARSLKNTGKWFAYGGTFLAACAVVAYVQDSPTAGPFLIVGAVGWLAGGIMIAYGSSKIRYYEERKRQLSVCPNLLYFQRQSGETYNPCLCISVRLKL